MRRCAATIGFGDLHDLQIAHDVDIGFHRVERDQLGTLEHTVRSGVDARGLAPDFIDRREAVEQQLPHDHRAFVAGNPFVVVDRRRHQVALVEFVFDLAGVEPDLRQQHALALTHLGFGRAAIGGGLADGGIGLDRLLDRVVNRERFRGDGKIRRAGDERH